jgi:hypothetical protein
VPAFHAVAGDPAGEVWRHGEELRRHGMTNLVDALTARSPLRRGVDRARAADVLYLLLGAETYRTLVLERGWSQAQWASWTTRAILHDLFDLG